jgi:putative spermidine/putrescine transport system ATP-binding protein/spermidine/putrescine transport system ATP-binding protein
LADYDLELAAVRKVYDNKFVAVTHFDLRVNRGEFISFVGPSGCGKTTTLRMIAGFEAITDGDILIRGARINDLPAERRPTSTIFQNFALFPHMTVRENVEYGLAVKGVAAAERRRRVDAILEKFEIGDVADRKDSGLSGGQRQRVALARGLVVEPQILLLDEPLGSLDANLRKSIQNELKLLQRNLGITFVFVTHAQSEALVLADRIVVMNRGNVEQISKPFDLYTRPKTPFVARFIGKNTILDGRLTAIDGPLGVVTTEFGTVRGQMNDAALKPGDAASVVIPSEAIDVFPVQVGDADERQRYLGNEIAGTVLASDVVAHTIYLTLRLAGGRELNVESHVQKYERALTEGQGAVTICWLPEAATIIRQGE